MNRFSSLLLGFLFVALCADQVRAQGLKWDKDQPGEGTVSGTVSVSGTADLNILKCLDKVHVFCWVNGGKESKAGVELAVGVDGKWGSPTNVFAVGGPPGGTEVTVQVVAVHGGERYVLSKTLKSKK